MNVVNEKMCFLNSSFLYFGNVNYEDFTAKYSHGQFYLTKNPLFQHKYIFLPQKIEHLRIANKFSIIARWVRLRGLVRFIFSLFNIFFLHSIFNFIPL